MDNASIRKLFEKLIDGTINGDEYHQLMDYLALHDLDEDDIPDHIPSTDEVSLPPVSIKQALIKVQRRAGIEQRRNSRLIWLPVAAAVLIAVLVLGGRMGFLSALDGKSHPHEATIAYVTLETPHGRRDSLVLPDGSKLWINAGSKITYQRDFAERTIELEGEAFFDVVPLAEKPFMVKSGEIRTTVLGTAFNVNTHDPAAIDVSVITGKVRVDKQEENLATLTKNQKVCFDPASSAVRISEIDAGDVIAWMDDRLAFRDIRLGSALDVLSRKFNVSFDLANQALAECVFSASFGPAESLDKILKVMSVTNGFSYKREGDKILLSGVGCP